jgi:cyclopropane-fatty-acyl-phospholipid synthase
MLLDWMLRQLISRGRLVVVMANGRHREFGGTDDPKVTIRFHDSRVGWRIVRNPSVGAAECYMDGSLTIEDGGDIYDLLSLTAINTESHRAPFLFRLHDWLGIATRKIWQYNPIGKAQRNVAHHYDLSDELYDLFLDPNRQYSCAYFHDPNITLEQAQIDKMRHIESKLLLSRGQSVLDIGCGWGGLATHLARDAGVSVRGLTLSERQHELAGKRADSENLSHRVEFALKDYRHETQTYDRIVSVGMFEHVGVGHYGEFFDKVRSLLKPDGIALLHTIGRSDGPGTTDDFIRKYIFPGGYSPALSEVVGVVEKTGLVITDIEVLRLHYAQTLHAWRRRFRANWERAAEIYDEEFCRMWDFYLAGCEVAFRHMGMVVFQIQLAGRQDSVPLTRDYITDMDRGGTRADIAAE